MRIIIIGGGAAGFFSALSAKAHSPKAEVILLEKSDKLLSKVRVSGGGRCNVTHHCLEPRKLLKHYPRGEKFLRKGFDVFSVKDTIAWFQKRGVKLKTEADGRMFPITDLSQTVVDCLVHEAERSGVSVRKLSPVDRLARTGKGMWKVSIGTEHIEGDKVIVASGGSPKVEGLRWLAELGHVVIPPVPSLFTFNLPKDPITTLMGVVADPARVRIEGSKLESIGPLLITHWGLSGPAVLKLSAWGARELNAKGYDFNALVNWLGELSEEQARKAITTEQGKSPKRQLSNSEAIKLPARLWEFLLVKAEIDPRKPLGELGKRDMNRLLAILTNDRYHAVGKTTFKEEFVTAGGVSLEDVDPATMESLKRGGLFFAGEVLDIDGVTGGFNFQAAWTTGWIAGLSAAKK